MSAAMLRRIERLERRKPTGDYWRDPLPVALALLAAFEATRAAEKAGRAYSLLPAPALSPEAEHAVALAIRDADRMAKRLAEGPK
jgi:hypothetical protein